MAPPPSGNTRWSAISGWFLGRVSLSSLISYSGRPSVLTLLERLRPWFALARWKSTLALLSRCDNLSTRTTIDLYTGGLGQPLASDVELQHPSNLQQAMTLARAYEQRQEASTINSSAAPKSSSRRVMASASSSAAGAAAPTQDGKTEGPHPRFRRLSLVELQDKWLNGQCYFCPEPYSKDHKCAAKGVFLMELAVGKEDPLGDITDLEISLYALTGRACRFYVAAGVHRQCSTQGVGGHLLYPHVHPLRGGPTPGFTSQAAQWPLSLGR